MQNSLFTALPKVVMHCFCDSMFSHVGTIPAHDRWTDRCADKRPQQVPC